MPLPEEVVTSVASTNFKTMGEVPAFYTGIGMANAMSHQQALNTITLSVVGSISKYLTQADPEESMSALKLLSGNDAASQIANLTAALGAAQVGGKIAGNMPPVTP